MLDLIVLKIGEGRRKSSFLIFGILGSLLTLVISFLTFSTNAGYDVSSDYAQYGFQWTCLSLVASLAGVSLSAGSVDKHRRGNFSRLLELHGLNRRDQYWGLAVANLATSFQMALVLILAMTLSLFIKKPDVAIFSFFPAVGAYLLAVACPVLLVTGLSFFLPPMACNLLGVLLVILGSLRGLLDLIIGNLGGTFSALLRILLKVLPPLSSLGEISRDFFFGEFSSWNSLFSCLLYLWILLGLLALVIAWVNQNEG